MKEMILTLLFTLSLFTSAGCTNNSTCEIMGTIWIMGGPGQESGMFDIINDKSIKVLVGDIYFNTEKKERVIGTNVTEKIITPSLHDWEIITELLGKIAQQDEDIINPYNDAVEITALINEKIYWTPLSSDSNENELLLNLTKVLVELSPMQVGGEQNPIIVPKQN